MNRYLDLDHHGFQALMAGKFLAMREHWMTEARVAKGSRSELLATYVSLARSAHRSYCRNLSRAIPPQRRRAA